MRAQEFFAGDPRRRASKEIAFGIDWRDAKQPALIWGLHWLMFTAELYTSATQKPIFTGGGDSISFRVPGTVSIEVVALIPDRDQVEAALAGWKEAHAGPDGMFWLRERIATAIAQGDAAAPDRSGQPTAPGDDFKPVSVWLCHSGPDIAGVAARLQEFRSLTPRRARRIARRASPDAPAAIVELVDERAAQQILASFEDLGAKVEIEPTYWPD